MLSVDEMMKNDINPPFPLPPALKDESAKGVSMEGYERRVFSLIIVLVCIVTLIFRGGLRELLLPPLVYFLMIKIGKHKVKDVRVPTRGMALDAFFDILRTFLISTNKKPQEGESICQTYIMK